MWLSPACPAARHADWKTESLEGHGRVRGRRRRCRKDREGGGEVDTQSDKESVGCGGNWQVTLQSLRFHMCAMGLIPTIGQLNEWNYMKGSSEGLAPGTLDPYNLPVPLPLKENPEVPGSTLDIRTCKLDLLQNRGCKLVCPGCDLPICLVFLRSVFMKRCVESALFLSEVFGRCTVFSSHTKIQISSSFSFSSS